MLKRCSACAHFVPAATSRSTWPFAIAKSASATMCRHRRTMPSNWLRDRRETVAQKSRTHPETGRIAASGRAGDLSLTLGNPPADVFQGFLDLIDQDQAKISRLHFGQSAVDGEELATNFPDLGGSPGIFQTLLQ